MNQAVGNLLAVIHGDGGHYLAKVGLEQACIDAEAVVTQLRKEISNLQYKYELSSATRDLPQPTCWLHGERCCDPECY